MNGAAPAHGSAPAGAPGPPTRRGARVSGTTAPPAGAAVRAIPSTSDRLLKPLVWLGCLLPLGFLAWDAARERLGANPIEKITHHTGEWALILLLATLAVTPVRRLTGWNRIIRVRRLIGLFAFSFAVLHFLTYMVLDQFFAFDAILDDIVERPYITVGFTAFVLLVPLAATSTTAMIRRLGRRWQRLHRLVYLSAGLGVLHYLWLVKADLRPPLLYGAVLLLLLALRLPALRPRPRGRT